MLPEGILNVFEVGNVEEEHISDRKVVLHVRRRRWKDEDNKKKKTAKNGFFAHQRLTFS